MLSSYSNDATVSNHDQMYSQQFTPVVTRPERCNSMSCVNPTTRSVSHTSRTQQQQQQQFKKIRRKKSKGSSRRIIKKNMNLQHPIRPYRFHSLPTILEADEEDSISKGNSSHHTLTSSRLKSRPSISFVKHRLKKVRSVTPPYNASNNVQSKVMNRKIKDMFGLSNVSGKDLRTNESTLIRKLKIQFDCCNNSSSRMNNMNTNNNINRQRQHRIIESQLLIKTKLLFGINPSATTTANTFFDNEEGILEANYSSATVSVVDCGAKPSISLQLQPSRSSLQQQGSSGSIIEFLEYGNQYDEVNTINSSNNNINDLAVALPINENYNIEAQRRRDSLPLAFQYDNKTNSNTSRNSSKLSCRTLHRSTIFRIVLITNIVIVTVAAIIGLLTIQRNKHNAPLIHTRLSIGIRENIERFIPSKELLDDVTSPYHKALDWITYHDPMKLNPNTDRQFAQRYILAYLYYATSSKRPWTSDCAPSVSSSANRNSRNSSFVNSTHVSTSECRWAVIRFRDVDEIDFNKNSVTRSSFKWLSGTDECTWAGIQCDQESQVHSINMNGFGLSGNFPNGITMLPFLELVEMAKGTLEGPLPEYLPNMKHLAHIDLRANALTGTIPKQWIDFSRGFRYINLDWNKITGTIPKYISNIRNVQRLSVDHNSMHGYIPNEIGNLSNLIELSLGNNRFNGPIPASIGRLKNLTRLSLSTNRFMGTVPKEIGMCKYLNDIRLDSNFLTGSIPNDLTRLTDIIRISLNDNKIRGTINQSIKKLYNLEYLHLENNHLSGSVPTALGALSNIQEMRLSGNDFIGSMPTEICKIREQRKRFKVLTADCAASTRGPPLPPDIVCPNECCTACCSPDGWH